MIVVYKALIRCMITRETATFAQFIDLEVDGPRVEPDESAMELCTEPIPNEAALHTHGSQFVAAPQVKKEEVPHVPPLSTLLSATVELHKEQIAAITFPPDKAVCIWAGAGTGKTTTMAYRIAWFLHVQKISADKILAFTFTGVAARQIASAVCDAIGRSNSRVRIQTIHSFCQTQLRRYKFGRWKDVLTVCDRSIQKRIVSKFLPPGMTAKKVLLEFEKHRGDGELYQLQGVLKKSYAEYRHVLLRDKWADFACMLEDFVAMMETDAFAAKDIRDRCSHVLVDEFQDCTKLEYMVIHTLAAHGHLTVVGDDDQVRCNTLMPVDYLWVSWGDCTQGVHSVCERF
eukprot:TRINITY_DN1381_c0_g1_i2.p1 TRINITY_DN1381_c0_g1~~TRINITY_DN1381_c0_g1_i2.p1  ORF type:complete len:344 (-),score=24.34 TRINITY_DN1381_c0_g1_i2:1220-2251(-)